MISRQLDSKHCIGCAPRRSLTDHGNWKQILETLREKFTKSVLPLIFSIHLSIYLPFDISPSHLLPPSQRLTWILG